MQSSYIDPQSLHDLNILNTTSISVNSSYSKDVQDKNPNPPKNSTSPPLTSLKSLQLQHEQGSFHSPPSILPSTPLCNTPSSSDSPNPNFRSRWHCRAMHPSSLWTSMESKRWSYFRMRIYWPN